jgi:hypothetical protein
MYRETDISDLVRRRHFSSEDGDKSFLRNVGFYQPVQIAT